MKLAMSILSVALSAATPAAAEWREYVFPELGIAKQFPAPPMRSFANYPTGAIGDVANADIYTADYEYIRYRMTVVDLGTTALLARSASILGECVFLAEQEGRPLANLSWRVEDGTAAGMIGRAVSADLERDFARKETGCIFARGRLVKLEATVSPERAEPDAPEAVQFIETLRFLPEPP
jgi:hypothetical protein